MSRRISGTTIQTDNQPFHCNLDVKGSVDYEHHTHSDDNGYYQFDVTGDPDQTFTINAYSDHHIITDPHRDCGVVGPGDPPVEQNFIGLLDV